ncbi:hypothetical protein M427DRAFT_123888 [Gonapodya prolifera JEL478]|uniref:Uncharacterized protein n=1 Tax=Gonapodya prolifera (strain JEL478) TaxID=1344416 RepID=A0A139ADL3_GONPJ|nr:hypothetical protein M427DRAFT_123888 [Gonapodya prolifera JEL478]|eukprot:KXS14916.1 hypothetical protein M427DRAFT_123888 [Gonapodya prolifera JEL478]
MESPVAKISPDGSHRMISRVFQIVHCRSLDEPSLQSSFFETAPFQVDPRRNEESENRHLSSGGGISDGFTADGQTGAQTLTDEDNGSVFIRYPNGPFIRCEDEQIHIPGAVQSFGALFALDATTLLVRQCTVNSARFTRLTPAALFRLTSFTEILSEGSGSLLVETLKDLEDVDKDGAPITFVLDLPGGQCWVAAHKFSKNPGLVVLEAELLDDELQPHTPQASSCSEAIANAAESLADQSSATDLATIEVMESTEYEPMRLPRALFSTNGSILSTMETFRILDEITAKIEGAKSVQELAFVVVRIVNQLAGFHRTLVYHFDEFWNGSVEAEYVDKTATSPSRYMGLKFPESDIPPQARALYQLNKVRLLYDRAATMCNLVCRSLEDTKRPLDMSHCFLRAMSPIHITYLGNMGIQASLSISIVAFGRLWGLVTCHHYDRRRNSSPLRKLCRVVGEIAGRNLERLAFVSRLSAQDKLAKFAYKSMSNSSLIEEMISSSVMDFLSLFRADWGVLSIEDEARILGTSVPSHEVLALLSFLRAQNIVTIRKTHHVKVAFPEFTFPGQRKIAGLLHVPLSDNGHNFITFLRAEQITEVKWGGNPAKEPSKPLEPHTSFQTWVEYQKDRSSLWTESDLELVALLQLVYWKFLAVWQEKEAALATSKMKTVLLANVSHEVRTPLNAIINYIEIALEQPLASGVRDALTQAHVASESLTILISDLLDLTRIETGKQILFRNKPFSPSNIVLSVASMFESETNKKGVVLRVEIGENLPAVVIGDAGKIKQIAVNLMSNALKFTEAGEIVISCRVLETSDEEANIEWAVKDSGCGIPEEKLSLIFEEFEQVESALSKNADGMGLGLAIVARFVKNMQGQLRLQSAVNAGSLFSVRIALPTRSHFVPALAQERDVANPDLETSGISDVQSNSPLSAPLPIALVSREGHAASYTIFPDIVSPTDEARPSPSSDATTVGSILVDPSPASTLPSPPSRGTMPPVPLRILIAEDNAINQKILQQRLKKDGHDVVITDDGKQCLDVFIQNYESNPFEICIVDLQMPILDGFQCCSEIRSFEQSRSSRDSPTRSPISSSPVDLPFKTPQTVPVITPKPVNGTSIVSSSSDSASPPSLVRKRLPGSTFSLSGRMPSTLSVSSTPWRTPIIACTAQSHASDAEMCQLGGMNGFIAKPIDFKRLRLILGGVRDLSLRSAVKAMLTSENREVGGWF